MKYHRNNHYYLKIIFGNLTINNLRDTYNTISESYQSKKNEPWSDLISVVPELKQNSKGCIVDAGAGNGRNLKFTQRTLVVSIDISENLLRNYVADLSHQRVAGSITHLPIRNNAANEIYSIAVVHHLEPEELRNRAIEEIYRVNCYSGSSVITVWRKWRKELKEKLIAKIRNQGQIEELVNHHRPWKDSYGKTLGIRFYHYYTWKELIMQVRVSGFSIDQRIIMGGKNGDANFLVKLLKN